MRERRERKKRRGWGGGGEGPARPEHLLIVLIYQTASSSSKSPQSRREVAAPSALSSPGPNPSVRGPAAFSSSASRRWRRQYPSPYSAYSSSPGATGRMVLSLARRRSGSLTNRVATRAVVVEVIVDVPREVPGVVRGVDVDVKVQRHEVSFDGARLRRGGGARRGGERGGSTERETREGDAPRLHQGEHPAAVGASLDDGVRGEMDRGKQTVSRAGDERRAHGEGASAANAEGAGRSAEQKRRVPTGTTTRWASARARTGQKNGVLRGRARREVEVRRRLIAPGPRADAHTPARTRVRAREAPRHVQDGIVFVRRDEVCTAREYRHDPVRFARPTRNDISGKGAIVGTFTSTRTPFVL